MPDRKHISPLRAPQTASAESSKEPSETDSLSETQYQSISIRSHTPSHTAMGHDSPNYRAAAAPGRGFDTGLHLASQRTDFWLCFFVLNLSHCFISILR